MAYRFLLEVPAAFENDVNAAVGSVEDAQILVSRTSHGLGIDVPYKDMSIAAHSLAIIPIPSAGGAPTAMAESTTVVPWTSGDVTSEWTTPAPCALPLSPTVSV